MTATSDDAKHPSLLEIWSTNERMRHIPSIDWMTQKLDGDVRRRVDLIVSSLEAIPQGDERRPELENALQSVCRAVEHVAEVARRPRTGGHHPSNLGEHLTSSLSHAVKALGSMDPETAGRRLPFQTFERSNAEPLYAALLAVIYRLKIATELARAVDRNLDERLLAPLVKLENPVDDRMLRPIA